MVYLILLIAFVAVWVWGAGQSRKAKQLTAKLKPITDIEKYAAEARASADKQLRLARSEADQLVSAAQRQKSDLTLEIEQLKGQVQLSGRELALIRQQLDEQQEAAHLLEVGYYEPLFEFKDLPKYQDQMEVIKAQEKRMLQTEGASGDRTAAAYATQTISFNGSEAQGRQLLKKILRLMLRAFNGECDAFIAKVTYRNIDLMEKRMRSAHDQINRLADAWKCEISTSYLELRVKELKLVYEWEEAKQREKEEQARIREQMREEERERKEFEKARQKAEQEEQKYEELLRKAQEEVGAAAEKDKAKLASQIEELQRRIAEIEEKKRAISQAELTKTGHVYIISNVGSFGEDVYKIGMTRRLEPMERVKELGDASVPFPFDVHAMIRTSNAPALENALHNHFNEKRLNLENQRKEFFRVSIEEIRQELEALREELGLDAELQLTLAAEAKEYRLSQAKRKHLEDSYKLS